MTISITHAFLIPLILGLTFVMIIWLSWLVHSTAPDRRRGRHRIYRCQVCEHVYLDARDVPLARCARCGCLNEAVKT